MNGNRAVSSTGVTTRPTASPPVVLKVLGVLFVLLGLSTIAMGILQEASLVGTGKTSLQGVQDFFTAFGGVLVAVYGLLILKRRPLALGRWWFLAAWCMNLLAPIGLFFLGLIIASTLILRKKYRQYFGASASS